MLRSEPYKYYKISVVFSLILVILIGIFLLIYGKTDSFLIINKYNSPRFDYFFTYLTYLGDGLIWVPLFIYIILWKRDYIIAAIAALVICTVLTHLLKRVIFPNEFRPIVIFEEQIRIIKGLKINRAYSFPSGHTSTAFTMMLLLVFLLKRYFWAFFFPLVAFFVGYSRVYLAQHFVTDVFAGMIIGIVSSYFALRIYEQFRRKRSVKDVNHFTTE